jgi:hypothetical protein
MVKCAVGRETSGRIGKLFASESRHDGSFAYIGPEQEAHFMQHSIADSVAVGVIDSLEMVDVQESEAQGIPLLAQLG